MEVRRRATFARREWSFVRVMYVVTPLADRSAVVTSG